MDELFLIIPPELRRCKDLSPSQKLILTALNLLSHSEGYAWASNAFLARELGLSQRTVINNLSSLSDKGYVKIIRYTEDGTTRRKITLCEKGVKKLHGGVKDLHGGGEKIAQGGVKKLHPNSTRYNNMNYNSTRTDNKTDVVEVETFFTNNNSTKSEAKDFFYYYEALGWEIAGKPVKNWRALAMKWISKQKPSQKYKLLS